MLGQRKKRRFLWDVLESCCLTEFTALRPKPQALTDLLSDHVHCYHYVHGLATLFAVNLSARECQWNSFGEFHYPSGTQHAASRAAAIAFGFNPDASLARGEDASLARGDAILNQIENNTRKHWRHPFKYWQELREWHNFRTWLSANFLSPTQRPRHATPCRQCDEAAQGQPGDLPPPRRKPQCADCRLAHHADAIRRFARDLARQSDGTTFRRPPLAVAHHFMTLADKLVQDSMNDDDRDNVSNHDPRKMTEAHRRKLRRYAAAFAIRRAEPQLLSAMRLARQLKGLAKEFSDAKRNLGLPAPAQATPAPEALDRAILTLGARRKLDLLWRRNTQCDYSKRCLAYDEFYNKDVAEIASEIKTRATEKVQLLDSAEIAGAPPDDDTTTVRQQWRNVAKNWLCSRFKMRVFQWHATGIIVRDSRKTVAVADKVREACSYIRDPNAPMYEKCKDKECFGPVIKYARDAVRMATAGAELHTIKETLTEWEGGTENLQAFLFVAATAKNEKAAKLEDCWFDPSSPRRHGRG